MLCSNIKKLEIKVQRIFRIIVYLTFNEKSAMKTKGKYNVGL